MNRETASRVSSLVAIAAPIDKPVVNIDFYMESFYRKANQFWLEHRPPTAQPISNLTNMCCSAGNHAVTYGNASTVPANDTARYSGQKYFLRDLLLVTIGGGSRDVLVRPGLTQSQFSDVHAMSTCIPGVWLTTDHLASVWCLQQVMAINRFLYGTIEPRPSRQRAHGNRFIQDKAVRLASAKRFLSVSGVHFSTEPRVKRIFDIDILFLLTFCVARNKCPGTRSPRAAGEESK